MRLFLKNRLIQPGSNFNLRFFLFLLLIFPGCNGGGGDSAPPPASIIPTIVEDSASYSYSGTTYDIDHVSTPATDTSETLLTYTLNLGNSTKDVYFIFTNVSDIDTTSPPSVSSNIATPYEQYVTASLLATAMAEEARIQGIGLMGRPDISLFNSDPELYSGWAFHTNMNLSLIMPSPEPPVFDAVDDVGTFYPENNTSTPVAATCRLVVDDLSGHKLNLWVADNSWEDNPGDGCGRNQCVNPIKLGFLANKFLQTNSNNDTYEWMTNIFGPEWGASANNFGNLISSASAGNLTILLFDIDSDNSMNGGVLGYFYSKDNFLQGTAAENKQPGSNERLMFYLDSVLFATPDGTWDIDDVWPEMIVSTLAHEFQHMINFYQKNVARYPATCDIWLNEMCSLVAEDLLASKLLINGPRGIAYDTGSDGGTTGINTGRLPRHNRYNYVPISQWLTGNFSIPSENNVLNSYAANYSFGAYLARNFGGANLFKNIVQNNKGDRTAIDSGLNLSGFPTETFSSTLKKWGVSTLLSNDATTDVPVSYRYNTGGFSSSTIGSINYDLGSINLYNYFYAGFHGPRIYTALPPVDPNAGTFQTSNMYFQLGTGLTGTVNTQITLKKGGKLTVLVR